MSGIRDYDYDLPRELIAQHPVANRSDSRLLVVNRAEQKIEHAHVRDLPEYLAPGDSLVLNNSRVVPAKLLGTRVRTSGRWQGLFLGADSEGHWRLLCKTRGKVQIGECIQLFDRDGKPAFQLRMLARLEGGQWAAKVESELELESPASAWEILERVGRVPLPPYIRGGDMVPTDVERYQTVYAKHPGSVAAPTAGLHLTEPLLEQLSNRGVDHYFVTLHVGIGTFRPIGVENLADHEMHTERGEVDAPTVARLIQTRKAGGRVVAVGTTSVRVLESAAAGGEFQPWTGETNLFIRPGHQFRVVDGLLTNFHLPKSTLLVLVRTFGGDALLKEAYQVAIEERYRFFSYGDAMLIL